MTSVGQAATPVVVKAEKPQKPKVTIPVATGRKSKYKVKYASELILWMSRPRVSEFLKKEKITYHKDTGKIIKEDREYQAMAADLPTIERFAYNIGVTHATLINWAKAKKSAKSRLHKYPEFFEAYNIAKFLQKEFLINNALSGMSPPASYIFTAKNITDMTDKTEVDHTTGGKPMKFVEVSFADAMAELDRRKKEKAAQATLEDSNVKPVARPQ